MQQTVIYEFPLNERMRNFMRLENYFLQINHFLHKSDPWSSQAGILSLVEILNVIDRNEIRSEIIKELERNISNLSNLSDAPEVNSSALQQILDELQTQLHAIQYLPHKAPRSLREDDLLNSIRQRVTVAANINSFDVPGFYYWLNQPEHFRQHQFKQWLKELSPIEDGVTLLNNLLRNSAMFSHEQAESGFYQRGLNPHQTCQMVRIGLPDDATYFPEASGNKHRISIRFLSYEAANQRPVQVNGNLNFEIACCGI